MRTRFTSTQTFCGFVFITPAPIDFILFYLLPTIRAFYIGLTNWSRLRAPKWVGFDNYIRLFQDEKFWKSIWVTFLYVLYNIPASPNMASSSRRLKPPPKQAQQVMKKKGADASPFLKEATDPQVTFPFPISDHSADVLRITIVALDAILLDGADPAATMKANEEVNAIFE